MDELPPDAKALLARARAAEQPPAGAEQRVRIAVAAAIGTGAVAATAASHASAAASTVKSGFFASTAVKVAMAGSVMVALGTSAVVMQPRHDAAQRPIPTQPTQPTHAAPAPAQAEVPEPAALGGSAPSVPQVVDAAVSDGKLKPATAVGAKAHRQKHETTPSSLHDEMKLLAAASAALEQENLRAAYAALTEHAQRYPRGQLMPERKGLSLIEACLAKRPHATQRARAYLRSASDAVLAARVAAQCKLDGEP